MPGWGRRVRLLRARRKPLLARLRLHGSTLRIAWRGLALGSLGSLCLACSPPAADPPRPAEAPPLFEIIAEELLVLGEDPASSAEEIFGKVRSIRTDRRGDIFVADVGAMQVRIYDRTGRYLRSIGGRGRRPGRFMDIASFDVTAEDEVFVVDGLASRVSRFSPDGTLLSTSSFDQHSLLWPRDVRVVARDRQVFLCKMPPKLPNGRRRADADFLLHVYDRQMTKRAAFGRLQEVSGNEELVTQLFYEIHPGSLWVEDDGAILYAPALYEGLIYRYQEQDGRWRRSMTLAGHAPAEAFVALKPESGERRPLVFGMTSSQGRVKAAIHSASVGLFRLRDGRVIHFTLRSRGAGFVLGAEVFAPQGRLLGYGVVHEAPTQSDWSSLLPITVEWKDENDRFYMLQSRDFPVVRVLKLHFSERVDTPAGHSEELYN